MALAPSARLGPYEIVSLVGAGGMGEVYKAKDTRLDRTVAIKILPPTLAADPQFRERFDREARTISQLDHPNICALYDVGEQDGTSYLVMQYLEGETLADRLAKGALPLDQACRIAIDVADALDKAHRAGIVHRDLKPGNIFLTKTGVKLLDFGLAKLRSQTDGIALGSSTATQSTQLTAEWSLLGTLQYMAPEQLQGKEADARSDIFAFGAVLYEMATGHKAFAETTPAGVIAAILHAPPSQISPSSPGTPAALDRIVKRCLAKDPEDRWQSARDLSLELRWIAEGGPQSEPTTSVDSGRTSRMPITWGVGSLLLGALLASGVWMVKWGSLAPAKGAPRAQFAIALSATEPLAASSDLGAVALSPDGAWIAYVATVGGRRQLYLRAIDQLKTVAIAGTEGASSPFFSTDGQWVGFIDINFGQLKKVSVTGGAPVKLCDSPIGRGGSWGSDGTIVFAPTTRTGLSQVPSTGGRPQPLTHVDRDKGERSHRWPEMLPGGKAVLFNIWTGSGSFDESLIAVRSLKTGEQKVLIKGGSYPRYLASGYLMYARSGSLVAVPFDLARLNVTGPEITVLDGVMTHPYSGAAQFATSAEGSLVYAPGGARVPARTLVWVDRRGIARPLAAPARAYLTPRVSQDGRRVAVTVEGANNRIWIYEMASGQLQRLTFEENSSSPVWAPDGTHITFRSSDSAGRWRLFWQPADGSSGADTLTTDGLPLWAESWSPDGKRLAFTKTDPTTGSDIWTLSWDDPGTPHPFLRTPSNEYAPVFSPDGRWIAYISDESGRDEVYVQPYPGPGGRWQVSNEGVSPGTVLSPSTVRWARSGRDLFYRSVDKMMAVHVATQSTFSATTPHVLFSSTYEPAGFDVAPDDRFLMIKADEQVSPSQIVVVQHWGEELKRLVPTK